MPEPQREPGRLRVSGSSYSKGIGSVASFLPLTGPDEGSILGIFELISVWAETAHFQLPTPREYWRGHISGSEASWDLPLREQREPPSVGLGATWFPEARLWLGGKTSPIGRVSGSGLSRAWVLFELPPPPATERVGPGIGIQVRIECLLSCDALTPVQS